MEMGMGSGRCLAAVQGGQDNGWSLYTAHLHRGILYCYHYLVDFNVHPTLAFIPCILTLVK